MEISPIAGIRVAPVVKVPPSDPELSAVFDIRNPSKPDDDTYSGSNQNAAGGEDDDAADPQDPQEPGVNTDSAIPPDPYTSTTQINYFA